MTLYTYHLDGFAVRDIRDWGHAAVLWSDVSPAHMSTGYWTSKGKWVKPSYITATRVSEYQNWEKTCRAFARVHGAAVAIFADDTAVCFDRQGNGRVYKSDRHSCRITWDEKAA